MREIQDEIRHERYPEPWPNLGPWLIPIFWAAVLLAACLYWTLE
jgi:hypothetical protein